MLFDDSLSHSVEYTKLCEKHDGKQVRNIKRELEIGFTLLQMSELQNRTVLIVDLWHPELSVEERTAIQKSFPAA